MTELHREDPHPQLTGSRFGFGGINAHVVLEEHGRSAGSMRGSPPSRRVERQVPVDRHVSGGAHAPRVTGNRVAPERVFLASAERPDDLLAALDDEPAVLAGSPLLDVAAGGPLRLAIADPTLERVALARHVVARGKSWRGGDDVWFSPSGLLDDGGRIAFAFPDVEPVLAPDLHDVAGHFGLVQAEVPVTTEIGEHGRAVVQVGRLLAEALGRLGIDADVMVGHGLGQRTAMVVSEVVPAEAVDGFVGAEPARFRELVENLYAAGVRVFLQPGVGSVTGLVGDTLHGREHLAIAAAAPNRSGLAQLARVAAALWVEGADVRFERLAAPTLTTRTAADSASGTVVRLLARAERSATEAIAKAAQEPLPGPTEVASTHPVPPTSVRAGNSPPPSEMVQRRTISLATAPELVDDAFIRQPDGVGTVGDRFPVVPMTMMVGLFVEAARRLAPDRIVVVGLQSVRALRWLAVEPAAAVTMTAAYTGPDQVKVTIVQGDVRISRAVVRLGGNHPAPPRPDTRPLVAERRAPHSAADLYDKRLILHGPANSGVVDITTLGEDGVRGTIEALLAPDALLDAAGQLLGYWVMVSAVKDQIAVPMPIARIDFFGSPPPPGTRCDVTVRVDGVSPSEARADIEIVRDGSLYARMVGFTDRRFDTDGPLLRVMLFPEFAGLARRDPSRGDQGTYMVRKHWQSVATRELVMRRYLGEAERAEYVALTALAQGPWLLGRIALKDAVRAWLWDQGAGPIYPIEVQVGADDRGELLVTGPGGIRPHVSLSLRDGEAVVVVGDEAIGATAIPVAHSSWT